MSRRITPDALEHAATWLESYEATDTDGAATPEQAAAYDGEDATAATMYAVATWLRAEATKRADAALVRDVQRKVHADSGRRPTAAHVRSIIAHQRAERARATTQED